MSILNSSRINFYGGYSTNVCTNNNNDILNFIDPVKTRVQPTYSGLSDEQVEGVLISPVDRTSGGRLNASNGGTPGASWNYYGDMTQAFEGVKVSSAGMPGAVTEETPLNGLPVYILGSSTYSSPMMIDTDPTGTSGTMIFIGGIQIGDGEDALIIRSNQKCFSYFIGARFLPPQSPAGFTGAAAMWQCSFPVEALPTEGVSHPALKAFIDEARQEAGVVLRFSTFEVAPGIVNDELLQQLEEGQRPINPAKGYTIGTVGILKKGELETSPVGRQLNSTSALPGLCSGTFEVVSDELVSFDLVNSLPKAAMRPHLNDLSDLGPNLDVGAFHMEAAGENLGGIPYDPANYFKYGGICDAPMSAANCGMLKEASLSVVSDGSGQALFEETAYRIQSDQRANFLEEGVSLSIALRVTWLGGPVPGDTVLNVGSASSGKLPDPLNLIVDGEPPTASGGYAAAITVPAGTSDCLVEVKSTNDGGLSLLNFQVGSLAGSQFFLNFRVYPEDDYRKEISAGDLTWDFVYEEVLRYYYLTYPAMSLRIPLNDPATIKLTAKGFIERIHESDFNSTLLMPPTREMSAGKRALLTAYLNQVSHQTVSA